MVSTRSGTDYSLRADLQLSKVTARDYEARQASPDTPAPKKRRIASAAQKTAPETLSRVKKGRVTKSTIVEKIAVVKRRSNSTARKIKKTTKKERTFVVTPTGPRSMKISFPPDVKIALTPKDTGNQYKYKLGESPYVFDHGCTQEKIHEILQALRDHHGKDKNQLKFDPDFSFRKPGHAHTPGTNFHGIVEPLLSGATSNKNQKMGAAGLFRNLTYAGGKQSTLCPNYHKALNLTKYEFGAMMFSTGKQNENASFLLKIMEDIRNTNIERFGAENAARIHEEALNAEDWMPGLLDLDFLIDLNKEELFHKLIGWSGIGPKIACCIVSFTFGMPVFIADTHAHRLLKWLGVVPRGCTETEASMHVDSICSDELKSPVHQALWHHGKECIKCRGDMTPNENSQRWKDCFCPLEMLGIVRFRPWKTKKHPGKGDQKKQQVGPDKVTSFPLKTQEERDCAARLGHEVIEITEDDQWGLGAEKANIKAEINYYIQVTRAVWGAFRRESKANEGAKKAKKAVITTTTTRKSRKKLIIEFEEETVTQETVKKDEDTGEDEETREDEDMEDVEEDEDVDEDEDENVDADEDIKEEEDMDDDA